MMPGGGFLFLQLELHQGSIRGVETNALLMGPLGDV